MPVASFIDYEKNDIDELHDEIVSELHETKTENTTWEESHQHLNQQELTEIQQLIRKYSSNFSNKPGTAKIISHQIPLTTNVPKVYRLVGETDSEIL